ncbi:MAG: hypothetical protein VKN72_26545 [Nostocales cyanobacterium 94392]|nr:hypothetical protein [Nostocales cyanobacterium 94392]
MIRSTILVGLMSVLGMVASTGSAFAQTATSTEITFTGTVGLSCEFDSDTVSGSMTYGSNGTLSGSASVRLTCTSPRVGYKWTAIDAKKDGAEFDSSLRATLTASYGANIIASIQGTNVSLGSEQTIGINPNSPFQFNINASVSSNASGLPNGSYEVKGTLTATPR